MKIKESQKWRLRDDLGRVFSLKVVIGVLLLKIKFYKLIINNLLKTEKINMQNPSLLNYFFFCF